MTLELGDPLQMCPVRSVSVFGTKEMLMRRVEKDGDASVEAQRGIKAFGLFAYAFKLAETKR